MPWRSPGPSRSRRLRSSRAGRRGSCAACSRAPRSGCSAAVGRALLEHDELIRRVGADESLAPVPVVGADRLGSEIGVVAGSAGARRDGGGVSVERTAGLRGRAGLLRQVVQRVDDVVHRPQELRLQGRVVGRAGIGLGNGRQVVAAGMAAQARGLVVPAAERLHALRLRLSERVPEDVEETVGVGRGESADELVAVLDELRVAPLGVLVEHDLAEGKRLDGSHGNGRRAGRCSR